MESLPGQLEFDGASFKDPSGRVFTYKNEIFRKMSPEGRTAFDAARDAGFLSDLVNQNLVVDADWTTGHDIGLPELGRVLKHRKIQLISYPYEWCFEMLKEAALLTLEVLERCLTSGFILKDATSFNVLFDSGKAVFVDVASIQPYVEGEYWLGYGQFCRCFLYPLMLDSYFGIPFQAQIRTATAELNVEAMAKLTTFRRWFRPGVFKDVVLQNFLSEAYDEKKLLKKTDFKNLNVNSQSILKNVRRLRSVVSDLRPMQIGTWAEYELANSYLTEDRETKRDFLIATMGNDPIGKVIDLGCNSGEYSEIAATAADMVIGVDSDCGAISRYLQRATDLPKLNPILVNLLDPSPALGWNLTERKSLFERITGDFFLALALTHHLRISGNVPFDAIFALLKKTAPRGIIEWVDREDPKVAQLLSLKSDCYSDYNWDNFSSQLEKQFNLRRVCDLKCGTRKLVYVEARA